LIDRIIAQQMALMREQLALVRGGAPSGVVAESGSPAVHAPAAAKPKTAAAPAAAPNLGRFGPFKGIELGPKGGLTPKQEKALAELTARYNRRTSGSKAYAQQHRNYFCDPRAAGNFRQLWKEMVYPIVCAKSSGGKIWDIDGNEYVDVTLGFGANYFGHSPEFVVKAVDEQLHKGFEIGPQSPQAGEVAQMLCEMTGMERAAFCNTGSEAVMAAMRVARTVTARDKVVYFNHDYHGIFDEVLARAGTVNGQPGALPAAPGIPPLPNMMVLEYGDAASLEIIRAHADEIAAVIVEPVQSRHPDLQPREFLHSLRALTAEKEIALVFDEVVTGFRAAPGGAQEYFGVRADLAIYGKVVGGGMPIGIIAGTRKFMDALDGGTWRYGDDSYPEVGVTFFAGTFVRHPLAMAAAHATLKYLRQAGADLQRKTNEKTANMVKALNEYFTSIEVPIRLQTFSSVFFYDFHPDLTYASLLFYYLRDRGVHIWEGRVGQVCTAHTEKDINFIIDAFKSAVEEMQAAGFLPVKGSGDAPKKTAVDPDATVRAPLTESQREIWIACQMGQDANCAYNESVSVRLEGPLNKDALVEAARQLVRRHDALRSRFSPEGDYQEFAPLTVEIPTIDLGALGSEEQSAKLKALIDQDMGTPFDLVKGPLVRMQLVRLGETAHQFIFTTHHAACDGYSFGVLLLELSQLYTKAATRKGEEPKPAMQYLEYAEWSNKELHSEDAKAAEEFWISKFKGSVVPALDLPSDRPRPAVKSYNGSLAVRRCRPEVFQNIKKATGKMGNTLFVTLFSAFHTLMQRLSGQEDIVVGIPAAGQTLVGSDDLVGHCLNFLPVRVKANGQQSFQEFSKGVRREVLDSYDHQNYTYGTLIQKLELPRDASRLPLLSVMFNIDKRGFDKLNFSGLKCAISTNPKTNVNFDIFVNLVQGDNDLDLECEFNTDLFDRETVMRWLGHYEQLMQSIADDPSLPILKLPLLSKDEQTTMISDWNRTSREFPQDLAVHALFQKRAVENPGKVAVKCGPQSMTYAQLDGAANKLGAKLQKMGVKQGDLVGLCAERSAEMVTGLLGILKAGAAYVPMDPGFPEERLQMMVEDAKMRVVVTKGAGARLKFPGVESVALESIDKESADGFAPAAVAGEDLMYVIFTSGSTGRPKGVQIPHRAVVNFLASMAREPGMTAKDTLLAVTTLSFDIAGLEIFLPLSVGGTVVVASSDAVSDGNLLRAELERSGASMMQATPITWRLLLESGWRGNPTFKILCGGEALPPDLANQLLPCCGEFWNMYGPTETTIWSTCHRITRVDQPISIGRPIDNTTLYVVNAAMQPQPIGVVGELLIGGDGVARGYHGKPELTAERFVVDPFSHQATARLYRTGDLARWHVDGTVECLGRVDQQVKIRGFRVELGEIEEAIARHSAVRECAVVAKEEASGQKRLLAFVARREPGNGSHDLAAQISAAAATQLPAYMVPTVVILDGDLPRTPNGKVDRRALLATSVDLQPERREFLAPRNEKEKALAEIWKEVLRVDNVSVLDNFFEIGGDSLLSFRVTNRATQIGIKLTPRLILEHKTIAELIKAAESNGANHTKTASGPVLTRVSRDVHRRTLPTSR
jgi:amino acid adenylation domain-containing protein